MDTSDRPPNSGGKSPPALSKKDAVMRASSVSAYSFLFLFIALFMGVNAYSQEYIVTNGYVCDPKNPGGEETRLFYRQQDGLAINISPTATFPVVCPVQIPYDLPPYEVSIGFVNQSTRPQTFRCALEENDAFGNKTRSQGNAITAPALGTAFLNWSDVFLINSLHYLSLRCILPPKGGVTFIEWY